MAGRNRIWFEKERNDFLKRTDRSYFYFKTLSRLPAKNDRSPISSRFILKNMPNFLLIKNKTFYIWANFLNKEQPGQNIRGICFHNFSPKRC